MKASEFAIELISRTIRYKLSLPQFGFLLCLATDIKTEDKIYGKIGYHPGILCQITKSLIDKGFITEPQPGRYELTNSAQDTLCDIFNIKTKEK